MNFFLNNNDFVFFHPLLLAAGGSRVAKLFNRQFSPWTQAKQNIKTFASSFSTSSF